MITPPVQARLTQLVNRALWELGLSVPELLAVADQYFDSSGLSPEGDPAEMRSELERLAWHAAAKGTPLN